jgi:DNA-binding phage protein
MINPRIKPSSFPKGMAQVAKKAELSRKSLQKAQRKRQPPSFATIRKVTKA